MKIRQLREGVTTGTCAAAAALASVQWQLFGRCPEKVKLETPGGRVMELEIISEVYPECSVIKDSGDDPDVTDGCKVKACVHFGETSGPVQFIAGEGIGHVTQPGLKIAVGEPAINPVPRQMIEKVIREAAGDTAAEVILSIPGGAALAKRTFNPRLGIEGGLSILGTTGILRPMSQEAMIDSICAHLAVAAASKPDYVVFIPGETSEKKVRQWLMEQGKDIEKTCFVQVSNFIGRMLDEAETLHIKRLLIGGFAGKLVKLAADIMDTHSHVADGRMETICTFAALSGADTAVIRRLYECRTVKRAIEILKEEDMANLWDPITEKAAEKCRLRTGSQMEIAVLMMDADGTVLAKSQNMEAVIE